MFGQDYNVDSSDKVMDHGEQIQHILKDDNVEDVFPIIDYYLLSLQDDVKPEVQTILSERLKALNNMGAAQMRIEAYEVALKSLEAVLRCQPNNVKALFRKGKVGTAFMSGFFF